MLSFVTAVHVIVCVFMIFVILLQPGKDAGMGSALGGGAATSAFGGRGAVTFLSKLTGVFAVLFFLTSLGLSFVGMRSSVAAGGSVATPPAQTAPATPGAAPATPAAPGSVEQPRGETPVPPPPSEGGGNPATGAQGAQGQGAAAPTTTPPAPAPAQ